MNNNILLLITALALATAGPASAEITAADDTADAFRLDPNVSPTFQQLTLNIDPGQTEYSGSTTIELAVANATNMIRLHALDMDIQELGVSRGENTIPVSHRFGDHGILIIEAEEAIAAGAYTLQISFNNDFSTDGESIYRTEHEGDGYIFSQFEAIDARKAFPCFDEPGYKYPWQLTITVPGTVTAITNTPIDQLSEANGLVTTVFKKTPNLPSYLITVAVGPFEFVEIPGMSIPGRVVTPRGQSARAKFAVATTPPVLAWLEEYFGQPYPFAKLDLIATFQSFSGAMEHPGAITYSDFLLLLDDTASRRQISYLSRVTAHELAHQWFGNLVTMAWWDDLWLNEAFADWMGDKTVEAVYPDAGGELGQLRTVFQVMDTDARATTKPIRHDFKSTDNFEDGIFLSYYKGKSVINMFEGAIGEEKFRDGVVRYIQKFSRRNATAEDFWQAFDLDADFDFSAALASFIDAAGIPLISVEAEGDGKFTFTQSRFVAGGADVEDPDWVIPVTYKYRSGEATVDGKLLLDEHSKTVDLGENVTWILPNADQQGYFRWQVPDKMLTALAADASAHLTVRERMGLVSNLWTLLSAGIVAGDSFVASIQGLSTDTHPSVVAALTDQLGNIQNTFITEELNPAFAAYIRTVLNPTMERISVADIPGESAEQASLRPEVLNWLADEGADETARAHVRNYVEKFLTEEIPASAMVEMSLRNHAARGDQALYERYISLLETAATPGERTRYLQAVGSFRDPAIIDQALDYVLNNPLNPNDVTIILLNLVGPAENEAQVREWLMANDAELRKRLPGGAMRNIPFFVLSCSDEPLGLVKSFYGDESRFTPGIENVLTQVDARTQNCIQLRTREQASVAKYLNSLTEDSR